MGIIRRFTGHTSGSDPAPARSDFVRLVEAYYRPLYQFAVSLTRAEAEASDMTQQTFYLWAAKGHQLRDASKAKTWLFTTLHREFLKTRRKERRFPHYALDQVRIEMPAVEPRVAEHLDDSRVLRALGQLPETYRAPLALFYLGEHSYKEIADILEVPIGTVQSRIARGKEHLQRMLSVARPAVASIKRERRG